MKQVFERSLHIQENKVKENNSIIDLNLCLELNFNTWSHCVRVTILYVYFGACTMCSLKGNTVSTQLVNLLAPELFFLILAHPVYKMRIIQEPNS